MRPPRDHRTLLRLTALAVGGASLAAGVLRGEHMTVLQKAVRICLECIGIG